MKPVLYVEDEPDDVFFLQRAFRAAGIEAPLQAVPDGETAMAYLSGSGEYANRDQHPLPRLLLLDVNLPHRSGFEVLSWVRSTPAVAMLPIVMLTSSSHGKDVHRASKLGANGYLQKPTDPSLLADVARAVKAYWLTFDQMVDEMGLGAAPQPTAAGPRKVVQ